MDFTLSQAAPADIDHIMALETAGFAPGIVEDRAVFVRRIAAFPEGFLLARDQEGAPAGYFCSEIWGDWDPSDPRRFDLGHDIGAWLVPDGRVLYVASMTVRPDLRGGGRGRSLVQAGLAWMGVRFPRLETSVLIVNEHWTGARKIYTGEGFRTVGRLPGFFNPHGGPVGDALVMERNWSSPAG